MWWKALFGGLGLLCAFALAGPVALAQDSEQPEEGTQATEQPEVEPPPPPETPAPTGKVGFWGDRFALYIEAAYGTGSADDLDTSITTTTTRSTTSSLAMDQIVGHLAVGWQLPADRGGFRIVFDGYKEDSYEVRSTGFERAVDGSQVAPPIPLPWWHLRIVDGNLLGERIPPFWTPAQDVSQGGNPPNGVPDPNEVTYGAPDRMASSTGPRSLQNRLQTVDALYYRGFGGRRVSGHWSGGMRYFVYEGNVATGAWLRPPGSVGNGFTDGATLDPLILSQDTSGIGPTGSLEARLHLFRRRLSLYAGGRIAFVLESLDFDSGDFFTLTPNGSQSISTPARLTTSLSKSAWHVGFEMGARIDLAEGLTLDLAYNRTAFQDAIIMPFDIQIPATVSTIAQGTVALYSTQDLIIDSWRAVIGYQF